MKYYRPYREALEKNYDTSEETLLFVVHDENWWEKDGKIRFCRHGKLFIRFYITGKLYIKERMTRNGSLAFFSQLFV